MRVAVLAPLLFFLVIMTHGVRETRADVLPFFMAGRYAQQTFWFSRVRIGTIERDLKAVADFASKDLVLTFPIDQTISSTYQELPEGGGEDVLRIGDNFVPFKIVVSPSKPSELGCPECSVVVGLGKGSPIYQFWRRAIYTSGSILLGEGLHQFDALARDEGLIECDLFTEVLCVAEGRIFGETKRVVFGENIINTLLPPAMFAKYAAGMAIQDDPVQEWSDLSITFDPIPGTGAGAGSKTRLNIKAGSIVAPKEHGGNALLLRPHMHRNDTVVIGRSAWRSFMMRVDSKQSAVTIVNYSTAKHHTVFGGVMAIVAAVLFTKWRAIDSTMWASIDDPRQKVYIKVICQGIVLILAFITYANGTTQNVLLGAAPMNALLGSLLVSMAFWAVISMAIHFGFIRNLFGYVFLMRNIGRERELRDKRLQQEAKEQTISESKEAKAKESNAKEQKPSTASIVPSDVSLLNISQAIHGQVEYGIRRGPRNSTTMRRQMKKARKLLFDQYITRIAADDDGDDGDASEHVKKGGSGHDLERAKTTKKRKQSTKGLSSDHVLVTDPRTSVVMSTSHQIPCLLLLFMVVLETRAESLWGLGATIIVMYLMMYIIRKLLVTWLVPAGQLSFIWSAFKVYLISVLSLLLLLGHVYVVNPTMERYFHNIPFMVTGASLVFYTAIIYGGICLGSISVRREHHLRSVIASGYFNKARAHPKE